MPDPHLRLRPAMTALSSGARAGWPWLPQAEIAPDQSEPGQEQQAKHDVAEISVASHLAVEMLTRST
jgi:hypothetical protein